MGDPFFDPHQVGAAAAVRVRVEPGGPADGCDLETSLQRPWLLRGGCKRKFLAYATVVMKLIGYSRSKLDRSSDVEKVFGAVKSKFEAEDFSMNLAADGHIEQAVAFSVERATKELKDSGALGFFRKHVVGVAMDNQAHNDSNFVYPHSSVQIEEVESGPVSLLTMDEWLSLAEVLSATIGLDLAFVMGAKENTADYYRTHLGCGIGLIKVFWINCFGSAYSELIAQENGSTHFFKRENFGPNCKAFVSASSYEAYRSASPDLLAAQRREIGDNLFNRLPAEKPGTGGSGWILNPKGVFRLVSFLYRQRLTDWRRYQAKMVPEFYRRKII